MRKLTQRVASAEAQAAQAKSEAEQAKSDAAQATSEAEQAKSDAAHAKSEAEQAKSDAAKRDAAVWQLLEKGHMKKVRALKARLSRAQETAGQRQRSSACCHKGKDASSDEQEPQAAAAAADDDDDDGTQAVRAKLQDEESLLQEIRTQAAECVQEAEYWRGIVSKLQYEHNVLQCCALIDTYHRAILSHVNASLLQAGRPAFGSWRDLAADGSSWVASAVDAARSALFPGLTKSASISLAGVLKPLRAAVAHPDRSPEANAKEVIKFLDDRHEQLRRHAQSESRGFPPLAEPVLPDVSQEIASALRTIADVVLKAPQNF
eukprot:m51a1_g14358 hypothetical protein (320) ;mRNA; f:206571-207530